MSELTPRRGFLVSLRYAGRGMTHALKTQRNMRLHVVLGLVALVAAWWLQGSVVEQLLVCLAVGLVLFSELLNTALEVLVDLVSPERHEQARIAKDLAAAAVLVCAVCSVAVAGGLLVSRLGGL